MTEQPKRPEVNLSRQRLVSVALMTVVGLGLFIYAIATTDPSWIMWAFGVLMLLSALAFWTTYIIYLRKKRAAEG